VQGPVVVSVLVKTREFKLSYMVIQVSVFWVVMSYIDVVAHQQHFFDSQLSSPERWMQHGPLKRWYPTIALQGVTTQKNSNLQSRENFNSRMCIQLDVSVLVRICSVSLTFLTGSHCTYISHRTNPKHFVCSLRTALFICSLVGRVRITLQLRGQSVRPSWR
jgi:hypothetical protein